MTELNLMPLGEQERCGQSPFVRSERTFPGLRRFSTQLVGYEAVLPWGHNLFMMNKNLSDEQTIFYAKEVISKSWSRDMLLHVVKGNYYENLLATPRSNNFSQTLPAHVSSWN